LAVTKLTVTGERTTDFLLNDIALYLMNTSATGNYASTDWKILGYTGAEKNINPISEKYMREDKIPRVMSYSKTIRKGLEIKCTLSNQSAELDGIILQGVITSLGATGTQVDVGTDEPALQYRAVRFVATRDDGVNVCWTIPKCEIRQDGEKVMGGESETVTPLMFKAVYNPLADADQNLYYIQYLASGISVTADEPPGYR
jgi:hypothetical protein